MRPRLNCKINRLASVGFGFGTPGSSRQTVASFSYTPQRYRQYQLHSPALFLAISPRLIVTATDGSTNRNSSVGKASTLQAGRMPGGGRFQAQTRCLYSEVPGRALGRTQPPIRWTI